jgi:hypothetical protein
MSQRIESFRGTIVKTNTTATVIGYLPPNAFVIGVTCLVTEAFNDATGAVIDVGISGTANYFANDIDVSAVANAAVTLTKGAVVQSAIKPTPIYATYTGATGDATTGSATIAIKYLFDEG